MDFYDAIATAMMLKAEWIADNDRTEHMAKRVSHRNDGSMGRAIAAGGMPSMTLDVVALCGAEFTVTVRAWTNATRCANCQRMAPPAAGNQELPGR